MAVFLWMRQNGAKETGSSEVASALSYLRAQQESDVKISDFFTCGWAVMAIAAAGIAPGWRMESSKAELYW